MPQIQIYTKDFCPFCTRAKTMLRSLGHEFEEFKVSYDAEKEVEMIERSKSYTVPQIFVGNLSIGGSDELTDMVECGDFNYLLGLTKGGAETTSGQNHV